MKRFLLLMSIALLSLTIGLFPSEQVGAQPEHFSSNSAALEIIAEVNALRASNDLPPYQENSILMDIAQTHADHLASTGVVTRFSAEGLSPAQRAVAAGYSVAGNLLLGGIFAENVHSGAGETSAQVVNIWKIDADSLNVMTSPDFRDVGAGVSISNGVTYYVLDVGASTGKVLTPITTHTTDTQSAPVSTSTPLANGEVYHIVQKNEALWSIALAYNTTIENLKSLNGLATDQIFIGQKLLIQKPEPATVTPSPMVTATFGIPTSTSTKPSAPTITSTATPLPTPPNSPQSAEIALGIIVFIALFASGVGAWLSGKKPKWNSLD
jgi:uncharacterized protein YkwD